MEPELHPDELQDLFRTIPYLVIRKFQMKQTGLRCKLVYLNGSVDKMALNGHVLRPLIHHADIRKDGWQSSLTVGQIKPAQTIEEIENALFNGFSVLLVEGRNEILLIDTQGWPKREIKEPQSESALKGPHQGLVESDEQNFAMIRRYIKNRELKMNFMQVGQRSKTRVTLMYLGDVAHPEVVQELEDRIKLVEIDGIIMAGQLEHLIEDNSFSIFPQFHYTERPDTVASHLLQGRIAIVTDGSPGVLIGPMNFTSFFHTADDFSMRWMIASFLRFLRFIGFFIASVLPSLYIAMISFHYEVIPMDLLISIGMSRNKVPFSPVIEAFLMELVLEMLREAGLRLPSPIGQAVGIVGGIVIGQAAVQAGIVSNIMVIVVSLTAIASFIIPTPDMSAAIRLIRFPLMVMASAFGMMGIVVGLVFLVGHLISLESLGTPYASPLAPVRFLDWKDMVIRAPIRFLTTRPFASRAVDRTYQTRKKKPGDSS